MTPDHGSVEPADASKLTAQQDDLEDWLHGIRTDLTDKPADWLATADTGDSAEAPDAEAPPASDNDDTGREPRRAQAIGRHRAED